MPTTVAPPAADGEAVASSGAAAVDDALASAWALAEAGGPAAALGRMRDLAEAHPGHAEAQAALGELSLSLGRDEDAATAFDAALVLAPGHLPYVQGLTAALERRGRRSEALGAWQQRLASRGDCRTSLAIAAELSLEAGKPVLAERHWRTLLDLDPGAAEALSGLAGLLAERDQLPAAIDLWQRRLRLQPDHAATHLALGRAWTRLMDRDRAAQHLRRYLALAPDDPGDAAETLAGLDRQDALPEVFVRCLFDQYAADYDANMVGTLGYRGPEAVAAALAAAGGPGEGLKVLDLGCGTGLMAGHLRPQAALLAGVDLSPAMVERARAGGLYDRLEVAEMTATLEAEPEAWDLITAADALCYLGPLEPVLAAVGRALVPGGRFAATIEQAEGDAVQLKASRRFGHPWGHVQQAATAAGLDVLAMQEASYRTDRGRPIPGRAFVLQKRTRTL